MASNLDFTENSINGKCLILLQETIGSLGCDCKIKIQYRRFCWDLFSIAISVLLRPDLKICWFTITQPGLQKTCGSKSCFDVHAWKKKKKKKNSHKYIINKD